MTKRIFDIIFSLVGFILLLPILLFVWILSAVDTSSNGVFLQERVGQFGKLFHIYKFRTMHLKTNEVSKKGRFLRRFKLDELPQLINVLKGEMSIVGHRPDIFGYYDTLEGENRKILELKPGLTSEAAIKYTNEEELLAQQSSPLQYNDKVLFPDKVQLNLEYYYHRTFWGDLKIIWKTVFVVFK